MKHAPVTSTSVLSGDILGHHMLNLSLKSYAWLSWLKVLVKVDLKSELVGKVNFPLYFTSRNGIPVCGTR